MPSFFSRLFGAAAPAREAKYSRAAKLLAMHSIGLPQWTSRNSAAMTREGYERNAVCHRCVRMVAEAAASVPWLMYQGREELIDHPLLALIERPNPLDTSVSFIEAICANLLLYGNAYIESVLIDGQLRELYALRPDRMSVEPGRNGCRFRRTAKHALPLALSDERHCGSRLPFYRRTRRSIGFAKYADDSSRAAAHRCGASAKTRHA